MDDALVALFLLTPTEINISRSSNQNVRFKRVLFWSKNVIRCFLLGQLSDYINHTVSLLSLKQAKIKLFLTHFNSTFRFNYNFVDKQIHF